MTTPAPAQAQTQPYPPGQPPPPPQPSSLDDPALILALSLLLITAVSAAVVLAALKARFVMGKAAWDALSSVLDDVMASPPPVTGVIGSASEQTGRMNAARRAQYVAAAARRVRTAAEDARAHGQPIGAAREAALATERRYYAQHLKAMWDRASAAGRIDMEAATHGRLLGWYTRIDRGTTAECLKADRHNFYVDSPPDIGLPGIGPHAGCRCSAGPPWPGGKLLAGSGPGYARAA